MHKPIRKRIPRNSYVIYNTMDIWQDYLLDLENISYYNDNYRYTLNVIDVFSPISISFL
jgi:hypothetical protein